VQVLERTLCMTIGLIKLLLKKFPVVSLGIFSGGTNGIMCPGVDSASKNYYQVFLLG
jgi:hypothetical protein